MPVIFSHSGPGFAVGVWHITESPHALAAQSSQGDVWFQTAISLPPLRQAQYMAERVLLNQLLPDLSSPDLRHTPEGMPYLANSDVMVSFSHTRQLLAVEISREWAPGIDLEYPAPRVCRVVPRVTSEAERQLMFSTPALSPQLAATLLWCAKETLFKCSRGALQTIVQANVTHIAPPPHCRLQARYALSETAESPFTLAYVILPDTNGCVMTFRLPPAES